MLAAAAVTRLTHAAAAVGRGRCPTQYHPGTRVSIVTFPNTAAPLHQPLGQGIVYATMITSLNTQHVGCIVAYRVWKSLDLDVSLNII